MKKKSGRRPPAGNRRRQRRPEERLVFTGGGTGGHLFPGIAVAQAWAASYSVSMSDLLWIGSGKKMEADICARFQMPYKAIVCGKLRRYCSFQNILDFFKVGIGFIQVFFFFLFHRPSVVFSKGGYVSVGPCLAAKLLRIPFVSHESDLTPGLATRINSRFASEILTAYRETAQYLGKSVRCRWVGNPVRDEIYHGNREKGLTLASVPPGKRVILVLGGSLGAEPVNRLVEAALPLVQTDCYWIHQTGAGHSREGVAGGNREQNRIEFAFLNDELPHCLACADLVVSRAGAGTLWENVAAQKPAVLIPLGTSASRGDQIVNARYFESQGAAVVLDETTVTGEALAHAIDSLLSDSASYATMKARVGQLSNRHAAADIVKELSLFLTHP